MEAEEEYVVAGGIKCALDVEESAHAAANELVVAPRHPSRLGVKVAVAGGRRVARGGKRRADGGSDEEGVVLAASATPKAGLAFPKLECGLHVRHDTAGDDSVNPAGQRRADRERAVRPGVVGVLVLALEDEGCPANLKAGWPVRKLHHGVDQRGHVEEDAGVVLIAPALAAAIRSRPDGVGVRVEGLRRAPDGE